MWAWIFCWVFCATGIFQRCSGKVVEHRLGANLRPSDYEADILPLRHCLLVYRMLWHLLCSFLGFSSRFCSYWQPNFPVISSSYLLGFSSRICSYWQPNFPAVSGSYLPRFSGRICSYWQPNFLAVSVVTCWDFLTLPFPARKCKKSPSRYQKAGIFWPYLLFLAGIFRP